MTDRERAEAYIRIFVGAGDRWKFHVPVDCDRTKRGVRIGSVEVGPVKDKPGVWFLDDGHEVKHFAKAVSP